MYSLLSIGVNHSLQPSHTTLYAKPHLVYVLQTGIKILHPADEKGSSHVFSDKLFCIY